MANQEEDVVEVSSRDVAHVQLAIKSTSRGRLRVEVSEDPSNIFLVADRSISRGECGLGCPAAGIAIEAAVRAEYCSFCASVDSVVTCTVCKVLGFCKPCQSTSKLWHCTSGCCSYLRALQRAFDYANPLDSTTLLAFLIMYRFWWDHHRQKQHDTLCPLLPVDWKLFRNLYRSGTHPGLLDHHLGLFSTNLRQLSSLFNGEAVKFLCDGPRIQRFLDAVLSNSHAITLASLPLGHQHVGRGLFLYHSFYNHSCGPNVQLSCVLPRRVKQQTRREGGAKLPDQLCSVIARIHAVQDIAKGETVSISYIPMSGLSRRERQERLRDSYQFCCNCRCCDLRCEHARRWELGLELPAEADVDALREVQFHVDESLLHSDADLGQAMSMVQMLKRGIDNQSLPDNHEVCIETGRLEGLILGRMGRCTQAACVHRDTLLKAEALGPLFDPLTKASLMTPMDALELLKVVLGNDHPWVYELNHDISNELEPKRRKV